MELIKRIGSVGVICIAIPPKSFINGYCFCRSITHAISMKYPDPHRIRQTIALSESLHANSLCRHYGSMSIFGRRAVLFIDRSIDRRLLSDVLKSLIFLLLLSAGRLFLFWLSNNNNKKPSNTASFSFSIIRFFIGN